MVSAGRLTTIYRLMPISLFLVTKYMALPETQYTLDSTKKCEARQTLRNNLLNIHSATQVSKKEQIPSDCLVLGSLKILL